MHRFDPRRRRSRWTRLAAYLAAVAKHRAGGEVRKAAVRNAAAQARRRGRKRLAMRMGTAPGVLMIVLGGLWLVGGDPLPAATEQLPGGAERVDAQFSRCGGLGSFYCVVDGDTIRLGERRIRLIGFDTPEKSARCEAERLAAERATNALREWLNRGPFVLRVQFGTARLDRYGRDLREVLRDQGRTMEELSRYMVEGGFARAYGGGMRAGWC